MSGDTDTPRGVVAGQVAQSSAAGAAANAVLGSVLDEVVTDPNMSPEIRQASLGHLQNMGIAAPSPNAAPVAPYQPQQANDPSGTVSALVEGLVPSPAQVAAVAEAQPAEPALAEPVIPDDVAAWLEEDFADEDGDEEDDPAPIAATADEEEFVDEDVARERAARIKAERRAEHFKGLRVRESRGKWADEVGKARLTVTDEQIASIRADSRRGFWREAKALHDQNVSVLAQLGVDPAQVRAQVAEETRVESRAAAQAAWGKPVVTGPAPTAPQVTQRMDHEARVAKARRGGSFHKVIRELMSPNG